MLPNDSQRARLRGLLDVPVPAGGLDTDTPFTAAEIDALLVAAPTMEAAAAAGWELRALRALTEHDGLERFSLDQQSFTFVSAEKVRAHALAMRDLFAQKVAAAAREIAVPPAIGPVAGGLRAPVFSLTTDGPPGPWKP